MPRVYKVNAARKARPSHNIEVGDTYYYWTFRRGGKQYSKTYPKPWDLTQSEFLGQKYRLEHQISELTTTEFVEGAWEAIVDEIDALAEEQEEKHQNMPENLQYSPTAELLEERHAACEAWAEELREIGDRECWEDEPEKPGDEPDEPDEDDFDTEKAYNEAYEKWQAECDEINEQQEQYDAHWGAVVEALEEFQAVPCEC